MAYITVADMRAEGVTEQVADAARLQNAIDEAQDELEQLTGYFFEPRTLTLKLDGTDSPLLKFNDPLISITSLKILQPDGTVLETVEAVLYKVYNRHLTQRLNHPDDRRFPRIELISDLQGIPENVVLLTISARLRYFPEGNQNIEVVGKFGYTDYSATVADGVTPRQIKRALRLLTLRHLPKLTDYAGREDAERWRITSERTRDQGYAKKIGGPFGEVGPLTGDWEIDQILVNYLRPAYVGST